MAIVTIHGAITLERYTEKMLVQGFKNNSWHVQEAGSEESTDAIIFQLHGAPQSEKEDKDIIDMIKSAVGADDKIKIVVLLHRPDELQKYTLLRKVLSNPAKKIGLVFLGDKHINDDFFPSHNIMKRVIPHGFFQISDKLQIDPIIIGSHTTWGEMRSVEHALKLLFEIFKAYSHRGKRLVGYIGGKPKDQLEISYLKRIWGSLDQKVPVNFLETDEYQPNKADSGDQNIILVNSTDQQPSNLTFNIQMYYLGKRVRTGESSGSLHASAGIPVILEMNGSEKIEDLRVINVPYGDVNDINSIDFAAGAKKIIQLVESNSHVAMLKHNLKQSLLWSNTHIAAEYIRLFSEL